MAGRRKQRAVAQLIESQFSEDQVFSWVVEGWSQRRIAAELSKHTKEPISQLLVWRWLHRSEEASARYQACRELAAVADEGRIQDVTSEMLDGRVDSGTARVASENYKWLASKRDPNKYSERAQLDIRHSIQDDHLQALKEWHKSHKEQVVKQAKAIEHESD